MKKILTIISAGLLFMTISCNKSSMQDMQPANASDNTGGNSRVSSPISTTSTGLISQMTVYYNDALFKVNAKRVTGANLPPTPINPSPVLHTMYVIKAGNLPGTTVPRFDPILDTAPRFVFTSSDIWQVVIITFTDPTTKPYQFTSAAEITGILYGPNSFLSATPTRVYFEMEMAPLMVQPTATE
jgi:hypothetical protein